MKKKTQFVVTEISRNKIAIASPGEIFDECICDFKRNIMLELEYCASARMRTC